MNLQPGDRIGDWIVESPLGAGGMGSVYRCHNALATRILAAVKVVHPDPASDFRTRFVHEVEALESLEHPAIVRVKGWGEADGMLWLAMDLVEGQDLSQRLLDGPLPVGTAVRVFEGLAAGLAHAHERNVFHRDIKPANILLQPDDTARIVDFGIALNDGRTRLSAAGMVPGTPAYLAPEVFGGNPVPRALDVYALGQLLCEVLTGEPAFPEPAALTTTQAIAHVAGRKLQSKPLDPGPEFPEHLREIVRRTTDPNPQRRLLDLPAVVAAFGGHPLPAAENADTVYFDPDEVIPVVSVAPATEPAAEVLAQAEPPRRSRAWAPLVVGAAVLLVPLLLLGGWATQRSSHTVEVTVSGVEDGIPTRVTLNGEALVANNGVYHGSSDGPAKVAARAGQHCDLDSEEAGPCCATSVVRAAKGTVTIAMATPPSPDVTVTLPDLGAWPVAVSLDDTPGTRDGDTWRFEDIPPGAYALEATAGRCPSTARGCTSECPPGCSSSVKGIEVSCTTDNAFALALAEPTAAPTVATPAPALAQTLTGKRIRLIHQAGEKAVARRIEGKLLRRGAAGIQLQLLRTEHSSSFGKVIPFGSANEAAAAEVSRLIQDVSDAEIRKTSKVNPEVDVVVWVRSND